MTAITFQIINRLPSVISVSFDSLCSPLRGLLWRSISLRPVVGNFCVQGLVAVDFQDFAVGIDFDLALAAIGGAVEFIDLAAVVGIGVIRGHGEAGHAGLGSGEDVGRDAAGLRGAGAASAAGCAGGAGGFLLCGAASAVLRGGAGGEQGGGGDEEQGFQCFHGFGYIYLVLFEGKF